MTLGTLCMIAGVRKNAFGVRHFQTTSGHDLSQNGYGSCCGCCGCCGCCVLCVVCCVLCVVVVLCVVCGLCVLVVCVGWLCVGWLCVLVDVCCCCVLLLCVVVCCCGMMCVDVCCCCVVVVRVSCVVCVCVVCVVLLYRSSRHQVHRFGWETVLALQLTLEGGCPSTTPHFDIVKLKLRHARGFSKTRPFREPLPKL